MQISYCRATRTVHLSCLDRRTSALISLARHRCWASCEAQLPDSPDVLEPTCHKRETQSICHLATGGGTNRRNLHLLSLFPAACHWLACARFSLTRYVPNCNRCTFRRANNLVRRLNPVHRSSAFPLCHRC